MRQSTHEQQNLAMNDNADRADAGNCDIMKGYVHNECKSVPIAL